MCMHSSMEVKKIAVHGRLQRCRRCSLLIPKVRVSTIFRHNFSVQVPWWVIRQNIIILTQVHLDYITVQLTCFPQPNVIEIPIWMRWPASPVLLGLRAVPLRGTAILYGRFLCETSHTRTVTVMSTSLTGRYGSFTGHYGRNRVYGYLVVLYFMDNSVPMRQHMRLKKSHNWCTDAVAYMPQEIT